MRRPNFQASADSLGNISETGLSIFIHLGETPWRRGGMFPCHCRCASFCFLSRHHFMTRQNANLGDASDYDISDLLNASAWPELKLQEAVY